MSDDEPKPSRLRAIALLRCPRCYRGRVFRGSFATNDRCPVCGLKYMREPGYFVGAMYFSYALAIPIIALFTLIAYVLMPGRPLYQLVLVGWAAFLPLVPTVYRYSRVMWLHFDHYYDPSTDDDAPTPET